MSMGGLAGAVVRLGAFLDDKINPVIKPVMESVKTEGILELQEHSATVVPTLLKVCLRRGLSNVVEKYVAEDRKCEQVLFDGPYRELAALAPNNTNTIAAAGVLYGIMN